MEPVPRSAWSRGIQILQSPTLIITIILIAVYIVVGAIVGNFSDPLQPVSPGGGWILDLLVQCDSPLPILPWTGLTTIFLHVNILHIASNLLFLLFFGFILEEEVSKSQWITTLFITGSVGSLRFVAYDFTVDRLTGFPNPTSVPERA